ncbi:hypothetical protein HZI73_25345 [Vallitalea pronyensis]|uniref:Uncharacterized protein n=1 Tax=Vallitalea pronyensis TaxID=1348613 RepID=A0A8J8MQ79_9FIRM|nr:hypothetical protein [Vallitalea pronyensis]QUI25418.1 hypothetical protein HZI73_25345 [Vallitalea pronyensis]
MLNKLSNTLINQSKLWKIFLLLAIMVALFMSLPAFESYFQITDMASLDELQFYSSDDIYQILDQWGTEGQRQQMFFHFTWDLALPITYFFFLAYLFSWLTKRGFKQDNPLQKLNLLSLVAVVDILENLSMLALVLLYPTEIQVLAFLKTAFTLIKFYIFGPLISLGLFVSIIATIKNSIFKAKKKERN